MPNTIRTTSRVFRVMTLTASALVLSACSHAASPTPTMSTRPLAGPPRPGVPAVHLAQCTGPATSLPDSLARLVSPMMARMNGDTQWANLARTIPGGFAGYLYDETHTPILWLTHPDRAAEAKEALTRNTPGFPFAMATVREARWDFAQLVDWYNYLFPRIPVAITLGDKDESINRIHFAVRSIAARDSLVSALSALSVPCDLVVVDLNGLVRVW